MGTALTREERHIYSRLTRRGFMGATAAATLGALAGREPRVRDLVLEVQRDLASDASLLARAGDPASRLVDELGAHHNNRRDVGRKAMADARVLDDEPRRDAAGRRCVVDD
jgi:hypothetical protein